MNRELEKSWRSDVWKFLRPISPFLLGSRVYPLRSWWPPPPPPPAGGGGGGFGKNSIRRAINQSVATTLWAPCVPPCGLPWILIAGHNEASFRLNPPWLFTSYKLFKFRREEEKKKVHLPISFNPFSTSVTNFLSRIRMRGKFQTICFRIRRPEIESLLFLDSWIFIIVIIFFFEQNFSKIYSIELF